MVRVIQRLRERRDCIAGLIAQFTEGYRRCRACFGIAVRKQLHQHGNGTVRLPVDLEQRDGSHRDNSRLWIDQTLFEGWNRSFYLRPDPGKQVGGSLSQLRIGAGQRAGQCGD